MRFGGIRYDAAAHACPAASILSSNHSVGCLGRAFSGDCAGDGPSTRGAIAVQKRDLCKKTNGSKGRRRIAKLSKQLIAETLASKTRPKKSEPERGETKLDECTGIAWNPGLDSQSGIHGVPVDANSTARVFPGGISQIAAPLHVSGVVGGDITLAFTGTAVLHLVDADNGGTFPMSIPGAYAVPPSLASWDTTILSQSALMKADPRNHFISMSRGDPAQPHATDLGLCLFSRSTGKMHCTRIHDLDFRWWLSGRTTPQRKSGAENVEVGRGTGAGSRVNTVLCRFHDDQADAIAAVPAPDTSEKLWAHVNAVRRTHLRVKPIVGGRPAAAIEAETSGTAHSSDMGASITPPPSILKKSKRKRVAFEEDNLSRDGRVAARRSDTSTVATKFTPRTTSASVVALPVTDGVSYQISGSISRVEAHFPDADLIVIMHEMPSGAATAMSSLSQRIYTKYPRTDPRTRSSESTNPAGTANLKSAKNRATEEATGPRVKIASIFTTPKLGVFTTKAGCKFHLKCFTDALHSMEQIFLRKVERRRERSDVATSKSLDGTVIAMPRALGCDRSAGVCVPYKTLLLPFCLKMQALGACVVTYGSIARHVHVEVPTGPRRRDSRKDDPDERQNKTSPKSKLGGGKSGGTRSSSVKAKRGDQRRKSSSKKMPRKSASVSKNVSMFKSRPKMGLGGESGELEHAEDVGANLSKPALAQRSRRPNQVVHPSLVNLPFKTASAILGGASSERIRASISHWSNVQLVGPELPKALADRPDKAMVTKRRGKKGQVALRRPLRYGFVMSQDWKILSYAGLGNHKNIFVAVEHWSSCTYSVSTLRRDAVTCYLRLEDAFDYFDCLGSGPAQRLVLYMESDDDKSFNNSIVKRLCATRRVALQIQPARNPHKSSGHETPIQDLSNGANYVNTNRGGTDWSFPAAWNYYEHARNEFLTINPDERPSPPLVMLTGQNFGMEYVMPFLTEILGVDIELVRGKTGPQRVTLYTINWFIGGVIALDELDMKERRLGRGQYLVANEGLAGDSRNPMEVPAIFNSFRLNKHKLPAPNQGIVSPFSAQREGLVRDNRLSAAGLGVYLRNLQRGLRKATPEEAERLGDHAKPDGDARQPQLLQQPHAVKASRIGGKDGRSKAKAAKKRNAAWAKKLRGARRKYKEAIGSKSPVPARVQYEAPDDAALYAGTHDDVCQICLERGGTVEMCATCPRVCHHDKQCAMVQPIHPVSVATAGASASTADGSDRLWYCRDCVAAQRQGTYVTKSDLEAQDLNNVLVDGSEEFIGATFAKVFEGYGIFNGTVESYCKATKLYFVTYPDGDCESLTHVELMELGPTNPNGSQPSFDLNFSANKRATAAAQRKMNRALAAANAEHRAEVPDAVVLRATRAARRNVRSNQVSANQKRRENTYRILQRRSRQVFARACNSLHEVVPKVMGIPIEFLPTHKTDQEDIADAEWLEDCTLEAVYDFSAQGTSVQPRLVVNAMTVHDEDNPRPKTVLDPAHPEHKQWCAAIAAELWGLSDRNVFEPVTFDSLTMEEKRMILTSKLVLRAKRSPITGEISRFKARLTAGGHRSVEGYHYTDSNTPGAAMTSPRLMACTAALTSQVLYSWDIFMAYTQSPLKQGKTIHIHIPPELQRLCHHQYPDDLDANVNPLSRMKRPRVVLRLDASLYGLKSAGTDHFTSVDEQMCTEQNLAPSYGDTNLYTGLYNSSTRTTTGIPSALDSEPDPAPKRRKLKNSEHGQPTKHDPREATVSTVAVWVYTDDALQYGPRDWRTTFMKTLTKRFQVQDAGPAKDILNLRIEQSLARPNSEQPGLTSKSRRQNRGEKATTVRLSQRVYAEKMLKDCKNTVFVDPESVPRRKTPIDARIFKKLDCRLPRKVMNAEAKARGEPEPYPADQHQSPHGYVSRTGGDDDLQQEETRQSFLDNGFECEELVVNDESHDPTRWSLERMQSHFEYGRLVAQIGWLARNTRPDICVAHSVLARHMVGTPLLAYQGLVQCLRYVASTLEFGLTYDSSKGGKPIFYFDADHVRGRPRCGYVVMLGGCAIDWQSCLSTTVAMATAEAELYSAIIGQKRALIIRKDLEALRIISEDEPIDAREDNSATFLNLSRRVTDYSRMKHIENGFLKCLEWQCRDRVAWSLEPTTTMYADFFTKVQPVALYQAHRAHVMNLPVRQ